VADVSVRAARATDAELVARVQVETWRTAYASLLPPLDLPLDQVAAVWLNAIEVPPTPQHRVLVACEQGEVIGFAACEPIEEGAELSALLVEPRWGRRGHGSRLLAACVDLWRADEVALAVHWALEADTVMIAFLESAGWAFDGLARGLDTGQRVLPQRRLHTAL
jgi:GNAT superfamily N-acetyltransferase